MDELLAQAAARSIGYVRARDDRPVFPDDASVRGLDTFVEALPADRTDAMAVLEQLAEVGGPATVTTTGGRYFGFVTGGAHDIGLATAWLAAAWDQNAALGVMSPTAAVLDAVAGDWLKSLFGLPAGVQHSFVSGTSVANSTCMAAARDRLLHDQGWNSIHDGLFGAPPLRVIVGAGAHASVTKALGLIGLGRSRTTTVPADDQGRLDVSRLPPAGPSTLVLLQAGNVNSGACDDVGAVVDHFADSPTWVHVDGAFGLWAAASPSRRHLVEGIDRADSWAVDMHKWLNVTYDSAVAFVRHPQDLARTFQLGAEYIPGSDRLEPVNRTPDMSQRARAIETWAVLKSLGRSGLADLVDRTCGHAVRFAELLVAAGFEVHNDVVLNQVMVSLATDTDTQRVIDALPAHGTLWAGGSTWEGRTVIRLSVSSHATTAEDVDRAVQALVELAGIGSP